MHHRGHSHHIAWQATPPSQIYSKKGSQRRLCTCSKCILACPQRCSRSLIEVIGVRIYKGTLHCPV